MGCVRLFGDWALVERMLASRLTGERVGWVGRSVEPRVVCGRLRACVCFLVWCALDA